MLRTRRTAALRIALIGAVAVVCPVSAQQQDAAGLVGEMPLPGGLRGALQAAGDPATPDRSQFLLEFIRRVYGSPAAPAEAAALPALLAYLERSKAPRDATPDPGSDAHIETVPLGLPTSIWKDVVFGGRAAPEDLVGAILQSRNASLFYYGVLSLDDETRSWLATQPELVADVASRHAASFVLAAPALRVTGGAMRLPGGAAAGASWEALAGARMSEPAAFVRALLGRDDGRLAYFLGALAPLTETQVRYALRLDAPPGDRVAVAQRLLATFARIVPGGNIERRPFWRPPLDPALLAGDLRLDASGVPMLPGSERFWRLVFDRTAPDEAAVDAAAMNGAPAGFAWVCEQVFGSDPGTAARRYHTVLFASRLGPGLTPENARDSLAAVRAASEYPALAAALERGRVHDPAVLARAARRAAQLSSIGSEPRATRSIIQFQGALAILTRAASRRSVSPERLAALVSSLAAIELSESGDYEGAVVRWLDSQVAQPAGELDQRLLHLVAGTGPADARVVVWEGTRYRVDLAHGEDVRVSRLLGETARPYASSAAKLVAIADALAATASTPAALRLAATELPAVGEAVGWTEEADWAGDVRDRYEAVAKATARAAAAGDGDGARRLARPLLELADDLLARGLLELTYATALGQPERAWVTAADVAKRHTLGLRPGAGRTAAWELPGVTTGLRSGFGVTGSLLGLDAALAELALVRLSSKPPPRKPMLADVNRRVFVQTVALVEPAWLTDGDLERVVAAMQRGRTRVAALRTGRDALALAAELRLSPSRGSLLSWTIAHDPARVPAFLSPSELLLSGIGDVPDDSTLHAWGAPAAPRAGCLCLRLPRREPGEAVAGRWGSGVFVSAFPDLNLRLAELLAEMRMPAPLLGPVLAAAVVDFVNTAVSRDEDDRRGLVEFVQALDGGRLEQYLALLTTDGPLVPMEDVAGPAPVALARP